MSNYKTHFITVFSCLVFFSGCLESEYGLDIYKIFDDSKPGLNDKRTETFLQQMPGIKGGMLEKMPITGNAKKVDIYQASFSEAVIEKNNLLEFTLLNDSSTIPRVKYKETDGATQKLYLLKYQFTYDAGGAEAEATAVIFLSFRFRAKAEEPFFYCTARGPAYWGILTDTIITFNSLLDIKQLNTNPQLSFVNQKEKDKFELLFMPVVFPKRPKSGDGFDIAKILRNQGNRIGGGKPLVFYIPEIFHDRKALHFEYLTTIKLKH